MIGKLFHLSRRIQLAYGDQAVGKNVDRLASWIERRQQDEEESYDHAETVNDYYSLCHEFMEYGWGDSLHFAPLTPSESLEDAVVRHQRLMIDKLALKKGMHVIDVGCGVGGPMRRVATEAGVKVLCLNNNQYQLDQARAKNKEAGVDHLADYLKCNFMDMSELAENSFDAGYAIESTCHAPDKEGAFAQIFRVLKPGALLWGQEMCMTDAFDPANPRHCEVKEELMRGIALNEIDSFAGVNKKLKAVGFEIVEGVNRDVKKGPSTPWYQPMDSRYGTIGSLFRRTPVGRKTIIWMIRTAELFGMFPRNAHRVIQFMDRTADAYVNGGREGIFTPLYCFVARKP